MKRLFLKFFLLFFLSCGGVSNPQQNKIEDNKKESDLQAKGKLNGQSPKDKIPAEKTETKKEEPKEPIKKPDIKGPFGGDRPAKIYLPDSYDKAKNYPLIVLLHGLGMSGSSMNSYFKFSNNVNKKSFILITPDGVKNSDNKRYWNASKKTGGSRENDLKYLTGLIDEAKKRYSVDAKKVYLAGYSNGAFMSNFIACEQAETITAIVSFAGTLFNYTSNCKPKNPVSILQIHGTKDATVAYEGKANRYPGALKMVNHWVTKNLCKEGLKPQNPISIAPFNTKVTKASNCANKSQVELWTVEDGGHFIRFYPSFPGRILDWLLSKSK